MADIFPCRLLYTIRDNTIDEEFFGFAFLYENFSLIKKYGSDNGGRFFLRSLSKPVQASFISDFDLDLCDEEIAICCGSHCGTKRHIALVESILKKAGIDVQYLKCPPAVPLDTTDFDGKLKPVCNNCSAKHALMLAICKKNGWDLNSYLDYKHPLQEMIYQRHLELSGADYAQKSLDGCGAPVFAMKIDEIAKMFFNFFKNKKFDYIKNAIVNNPYVFGGANRLDSEIIELGNKNLISKVGAGGFVIVYNINEDKMLIVKMSQNNNDPRRIITLNALKQLGWIESNPVPDKIYNDNKNPVGDIVCNFSFL